jgi:hypothetical protein
MKKQTAVEWLEQKIKANPFRIENDRLWNEALEMEKQQIIDAYRVGKVEATLPSEKLTTGEQYYQETFKSE